MKPSGDGLRCARADAGSKSNTLSPSPGAKAST
jgi:hypothetical protein